MNDYTEPDMPSNFGPKYVFWMICRWIYFNPLTILQTADLIAVQLVADHPTWRWIGTVISVLGILIAQIRNSGKDYTIPVAQTQQNQAKAVLAANPSSSPAPPAQTKDPS